MNKSFNVKKSVFSIAILMVLFFINVALGIICVYITTTILAVCVSIITYHIKHKDKTLFSKYLSCALFSNILFVLCFYNCDFYLSLLLSCCFMLFSAILTTIKHYKNN